MNLLRESSDEDHEPSFCPAPVISHGNDKDTNPNVEIFHHPAEGKIETTTMPDVIWQETHYTKPQSKQRKKKQKSKKKHKNVCPWTVKAEIASQASITDRMAYKQKLARRTWFPSVGNKELPDTVIWHNTINVKDHLGRSWVLPPISYVPNPDHECYLPKSRVHKFSYHTSSVTNVEMFPVFGHLVLSCSLDTTIRIWSLFGDMQCLQTYIGHTSGVRDCAFIPDGSKFGSVCYGKRLKIWDTEKGAIDGALLDDVPSQLIMNTRNENECIVTLGDGRAVHYDFREGGVNVRKPVREYKFHSAPLTSAVFLPGCGFFATAGEDSALALWETGNEKPVAVLREQWMKPITALACHPRKPMILGQMQGAEIAVFRAESVFKTSRKRSFVGHRPESFACRMTVSPDGAYVATGDSSGSLFIWDWKTASLKKTFQLHDQVLIRAAWSPYNPSQIITGSWDNTLNLLD